MAGIDNLLDVFLNFLGICGYGNQIIRVLGDLLIGGKTGGEELGHFVKVRQLAQCAEEVVSRHRCLALEETEPEDLGVLNPEVFANLSRKVVIHDVLEVHLVQIVSPRVEDGEALMVDALSAVLHDIIADEGEVRFVGLNWVKEVVLNELFLVVANKRADGLNA